MFAAKPLKVVPDEKASEGKPSPIPEALNAAQKDQIKTTFAHWFIIIDELPRDQFSLEYAIKAYKAMISKRLPARPQSAVYNRQDLEIMGIITDVRDILEHECPQNRSIGDDTYGESLDPRFVIYKDPPGPSGLPAYERRGLLNLTPKNNASAPHVTKEATVNHIKRLVEQQIDEQIDKVIKGRALNKLETWELKLIAKCNLRGAKLILENPDATVKDRLLSQTEIMEELVYSHPRTAEYIFGTAEPLARFLRDGKERVPRILNELCKHEALTAKVILRNETLRNLLNQDIRYVTPEARLRNLFQYYPEDMELRILCVQQIGEIRRKEHAEAAPSARAEQKAEQKRN